MMKNDVYDGTLGPLRGPARLRRAASTCVCVCVGLGGKFGKNKKMLCENHMKIGENVMKIDDVIGK